MGAEGRDGGAEAEGDAGGTPRASPLRPGAAGAPRSLPPMPVPGTEAQHWYKGWETGPWGEMSRCCLRTDAASGPARRLLFTQARRGRGFLPEEVGPHQRGQEGAGTGQEGAPPGVSACERAPPRAGGLETLREGDRDGGVRDPERREPSPRREGMEIPEGGGWRPREGWRLLERAPLPQVFPFGVGTPCLQQQQPSSPVSSRRSLGRLLGTPSHQATWSRVGHVPGVCWGPPLMGPVGPETKERPPAWPQFSPEEWATLCLPFWDPGDRQERESRAGAQPPVSPSALCPLLSPPFLWLPAPTPPDLRLSPPVPQLGGLSAPQSPILTHLLPLAQPPTLPITAPGSVSCTGVAC